MKKVHIAHDKQTKQRCQDSHVYPFNSTTPIAMLYDKRSKSKFQVKRRMKQIGKKKYTIPSSNTLNK